MENRHGRGSKKRVIIVHFGVISNFFARDYRERSERDRFLRDKCAQRWQSPFFNRTRRRSPSTASCTSRG
ncbi:hypothetical protein DFAR_550002 [Desulfarculales bacterium]